MGLPRAVPSAYAVYWKYGLFVQEAMIAGGAGALARELRAHDILAVPRYIQKPAFMCEVIAQQRTFGTSRYPFTLARADALNYDPQRYPGTFAALDSILVIPWNERYTSEHVTFIAAALRAGVAALAVSDL